jgi:hypothetical protein
VICVNSKLSSQFINTNPSHFTVALLKWGFIFRYNYEMIIEPDEYTCFIQQLSTMVQSLALSPSWWVDENLSIIIFQKYVSCCNNILITILAQNRLLLLQKQNFGISNIHIVNSQLSYNWGNKGSDIDSDMFEIRSNCLRNCTRIPAS